MADYDDCNSSGGIFGTILSLLILAVIWPYLLAAIALYVAYLVVLAVLAWMAQNPFTVIGILLGMAVIYAAFHYRWIPKFWRALQRRLQTKSIELDMQEDMRNLAERKFIPSTNLYCYWCTKKLGMKAWEKNGKYYCDECKTKQLINL